MANSVTPSFSNNSKTNLNSLKFSLLFTPGFCALNHVTCDLIYHKRFGLYGNCAINHNLKNTGLVLLQICCWLSVDISS